MQRADSTAPVKSVNFYLMDLTKIISAGGEVA